MMIARRDGRIRRVCFDSFTMIIWLASYPRSGNTFFRLVLRQVFGLATYSVYDEFGVDDRQVELVGGATATNLDELAQRSEPCIVKTHELPGDDAHRAIYLVRDGRDVIVSYAQYIHAMHSPAAATAVAGQASGQAGGAPATINDMMADLITHEESFGGWGGHVEQWLARTPRPALVRFEDLIAQPVRAVGDAMRRVGVALDSGDAERLPSFEALQRDMPQFFRTGRIGSYRERMPAHLQRLFQQKYGRLMNTLGYST